MTPQGYLFYFNIPGDLLRHGYPDRFLITEAQHVNGKVIAIRFFDLDIIVAQAIKDWNALYSIAKECAQGHIDKQVVTQLGVITDENNVMPGIVKSLNAYTQPEKVKQN